MTSSIHRTLRRPHTITPIPSLAHILFRIFRESALSIWSGRKIAVYGAVLFNQCQMEQSKTRKSETALKYKLRYSLSIVQVSRMVRFVFECRLCRTSHRHDRNAVSIYMNELIHLKWWQYKLKKKIQFENIIQYGACAGNKITYVPMNHMNDDLSQGKTSSQRSTNTDCHLFSKQTWRGINGWCKIDNKIELVEFLCDVLNANICCRKAVGCRFHLYVTNNLA